MYRVIFYKNLKLCDESIRLQIFTDKYFYKYDCEHFFISDGCVVLEKFINFGSSGICKYSNISFPIDLLYKIKKVGD